MMRVLGSQTLATTAAAFAPATVGAIKQGEYVYAVCDGAFRLRVSGMTGTLPLGSIVVAANTPICVGYGAFDNSETLVAAAAGTPVIYLIATEARL